MRVLSASIPAVTGLLLAAQPTAARAATVEWLAGPLTLAAGQAAEVLIGNPNLSCSVGVQIRAGRVTGRGAAFPLPLAVNTIGNPEIVPAGRGLVVGFEDPNEVPGERALVQALVRATCPATVARIRR